MATAQQLEAIHSEGRPTQEKVDLAVKTAIEAANPSRIYLFGSWPRGEATENSDLDMAVFVEDERASELASIHRRIGEGLHPIPMSIDLIVASEGLVAEFMSSINSVYYKIVHSGELVYGNEPREVRPERRSGMDRQAKLLLGKAIEDEKVAQWPDAPDGAFGFHAQQAVEKLLKALLSQIGVAYERTHDLPDLIESLEKAGEAVPFAAIEFAKFQRYAVIHRYDNIPIEQVLDRPASLETVRILREHVVARIAALSTGP